MSDGLTQHLQRMKETTMALVILVRHGQTDDNVSGRISGQGPAPLNSRGQEQARLAAQALRILGVTHLYSSPVMRARQTAEAIQADLPLAIEEVADLREVGYGDWEGRKFNDIRNEEAAKNVLNDPIRAVFPNGESLLEVQQRGVKAIDRFCQVDLDGVIVVVSHGDVIRTAVAHYLGLTFNDYRRVSIDNGALSAVEINDAGSWVKAVNFVPEATNYDLESFYAIWQKTQTLVPKLPSPDSIATLRNLNLNGVEISG